MTNENETIETELPDDEEIDETPTYDLDNYDECVIALAQHLNLSLENGDYDDISVSKWSKQTLKYGEMEFLVVTDDEADTLWNQSLDSYLEECVYPDLPEHLRFYFDDEKWKEDARQDGRAHSLSTYDGNEDEETVNGETYYIYRTN